jgi:hypothetical protein
LPAYPLIPLPRELRLFATRLACFHPEPNIETGKPFFRWIWFSIQPVIGEFLKSSGDGCLKESATVLLPPI